MYCKKIKVEIAKISIVINIQNSQKEPYKTQKTHLCGRSLGHIKNLNHQAYIA